MGNIFTSTNNEKDENKILKMKEILNGITLKYINDSNFNDMVNLTNPDYCNKVTILTKDIINKYMTTIEIEQLYENITDKKEPIQVTIGYNNTTASDKEKLCKKIAEYYVLILYIFNTIKKIFLVNDFNDGSKIKGMIDDRMSENLCSHRNKQLSGELKSNEEPNIDELKNLYESKYPSDVDDTEFIKLKNNIKLTQQKNVNNVYGTNNNVEQQQKSHDSNVKVIMASQLKLINIINKIFIRVNKTEYKLNNLLTISELYKMADQTKIIITSMYLECEDNYYKSINN